MVSDCGYFLGRKMGLQSMCASQGRHPLVGGKLITPVTFGLDRPDGFVHVNWPSVVSLDPPHGPFWMSHTCWILGSADWLMDILVL